MSRSKSSAAKKERRRITRKARRARAANSVNSVNSAKKSKSSHPYPLRSLLGKADNQPLSTLNCPLPKTGPKTASKAAPKETAKPQKKEKKISRAFLLYNTDSKTPQHVRSYHPMPRDYVFVPKGNVYITRHCRSKTKSIQKTVYIVWDRTGSKSLGIRVPSSIHSEVREMSSETAQHRALIVQANNTKILAHGRRLLLKEYPKVPPDSLETILNHAFLKGSGRVGRSNVLTDRRKALLAVQAYIRHNLTSYEYLLKRNKKRDEARRKWSLLYGLS
ncbi:hypothetical protein N7450_006378 [Penicillium hetheringtonii]|uniref:DUF2293 domain-containing protein n=1 Tax=Penicillium hetheringtonii TaxID=911720 RepID=A0AAD6DLS5_9EURO|nr:hypothetical protein N7450_006378 [Penicillium hetheringtonii]